MILTMVLTVFLFGGTRLMAQDLSNKPSETQTTPDEEKFKEEGSLAKTNENEEGSEIADNAAKDTTEDNNVAVLPKGSDNPDSNKTATENNNENLVKEAPKTKAEGAKTLGEEAKTEEQVKAKEALEANKAKEEGKGKEDGSQLEASNSEKAQAPGTSREANTKPKKEFNPDDDKELNDLKAKIKAQPNPSEKAKLQKEYNEKYLKKLEDAGANKTDEETAKRLKDDDIKKYNEIKAKQEEIDKKLKDENAKPEDIQKDIDELNKLLGDFNPPRALTADEQNALEELQNTPYVPSIDDKKTKENGKEIYETYEKAKKALEEAINPKAEAKTKEELAKLIKDFKDAEAALKTAIHDEIISPNYTEHNKPEIYIYPIDGSGRVIRKKNDKEAFLENNGTYYIPDKTDLNLLFQINKDKEDKNSTKTFTFTIKKLDGVGKVDLPNPSANNLVFLNDVPVKLIDNGDGSYTFTATAKDNFGIAQLKFNMPGFKAAFHEGFKLTLTGDDATTTQTNIFLITKKGYENEADLDGVGTKNKKPEENIPEIDAGKTHDKIVEADTDKVFNFFTVLKKNNTYIDEVLVNSANGESLPLSSVNITITAPKNFDGNFAEFIHKSGLKYHDNGNGTYTLELNLKKFNKKDGFTVENGQLKYKNKDIKNTEFTNAILEAANGKKKYIENNDSNPIDVETINVLETQIGSDTYQVRFDKESKLQSLWKKDGANTYTKVKDFTNGKLVDDGKTFEIRGNELISYTKETDVYEGNVSNKKIKKSNTEKYEADPTVTPTFEGRQVTVKEGNNKESYGGTIVEKKIFVKIGKNQETGKDEYKYLIDQSGLSGEKEAYIDDSGKKVDENASGARKVENAVFREVTIDGKQVKYIVNDLVYKPGPTLIDKFGREKTNITVTKDDNGNKYTFVKKKDDKDKGITIVVENNTKEYEDTYGKRTITIGKKVDEQIFVNNKNYLEDINNYKAIVGKYYYDKDKKEFFEAKDNDTDKKKVLGDKFYEGFLSGSLTKKLIEAYNKDNKSHIVTDNTNRYYGSINPKDFYTYNNRTYVKKIDGKDEYLESADGGDADIIANFTSQKVIQTIKIGNVEKYVITDEKDIFDAVQNAKFAFRFPGFLSGKKVIYNVKADVSAKYMKPVRGNTGKSEEEVSIFSKKDGNKIVSEEVRTITKYFTIKTSEKGDPSFFKHKPEEFNDDKKGIPNYNFFNIFYRDSSDIERDKLIATLINHKNLVDNAKTAYENAKNDQNKKTYEDLAKKYKDDVELLDIIQKELAKRRDGAQFVLSGDNVEIQKNGEKVNVNRSLVWEIGFSSDDGVLFPVDKDTSIVVEDYNMDNRLVYDEIIINEEEKEWEKHKKAYEEAKKAYEDAKKAYEADTTDTTKKNTFETKEKELAEKKFTGSDEYFFLDQINNIRFGIRRGYVEGGFVAVGPDFKITREEIIGALAHDKAVKVQATDKDNKNIENTFYIFKKGKHYIEKNGIEYEISRNEEKGQIRIKVLKAFYKDNKDKKKADLNKFYSPVQEAYENQIKKFKDDASVFKAEEKTDAQATKEAFEESFKTFIKKTYAEDSDCYHVLTHLFKERLEKVSIKKENSSELKTAKEMADELNKIKKDMVKAMDKMHLQYLDPSKGDYKFDDMRFNAIRFELKPNITIAGAIAPQKKKKFDISSVIVPNIDVPYTDEFGEKLTNKDMYLNKFINQVLNDSTFTKTIDKFDKNNWNKKDESFVKVMREAYERLNKAIKEENITIADLVEIGNENNFAWEKYTIKKGNELNANDLAIDNEPLTNNAGGRINPWYIKTIDKTTGKASIKSLEELAGNSAKDALEELRKEFGDKAIDLFAYYMSKDGFNRAKFENEAMYKLPKQKQGPGIYGEENNWREKLCYPGVIGVCIEKSGGNQEPPTPGKIAKGSDGIISKDNFTLIYQGTNNTPNEEHPSIDKKSDKTGPIDISEKDNDGKEKDQKIKFTIEISVNQMTKSERQRYNIEKGMDPNTDLGQSYSDNGHYKYQNDTLIMDILPNIFKLSGDSKITLKVDTKALKNGDANAKIFENADAIKNWKEKIVYMHVDNLYDYYKNLPDGNKKEVLKKALEDAEKEGKITKDQKIQAVIAWLPEFEAPKGNAKHFIFELENILVDKKEFKDYIHNGAGEEYVNNAAFGDKGKIYFAETTVTIKKGKEGSVDKFLRIYDENGKIINENDKKEWFKGNAKLKFGDKFDYKLRVHNKIDIQNTSRVGEMLSVINLEDTLPNVDKGLKPVLRDFVEIQKGYEGRFTVNYYIGGKQYSKKDIEDAMAKAKKEGKKSDISLDKITKITISSDTANVKDGDYRDFIIPMMIPELDAKLEDGKVVYIGTDGEKHELGKAEDFFNLNNLVSDANDLAAENSVKNSNTVTVYLEKNRFIRLFKEFYDLQKNEIKKNRPEMKFDIYQYQTDKDGNPIKDKDGNIIKVKVLDKDGKPLQLIVNEKNKFTDMVDRLPLFNKTITIDEKGTVIENVTNYKYEIKEVDANAYDVEYEILDNVKDQLGFVIKAKNTEKPEYTGDHPKDNPKNVTVTIRVNKVWQVLNNGATPSIKVQLYANGEPTDKFLTLDDGNWSAVFKDLPAKDKDGKDIVYTVVEVGETNHVTEIGERKFEVSYSIGEDGSITITNKEIPPEEPKDEKPKDKKEPKKHKPDDEEERDRTPKKNRIPKTGVNEDLGAIYFAFVLLLGLVFIKKRYLVK